MPHFKTDVIQTRNECLRSLTAQRDIYAGAIACLNQAIKKMEAAAATWDDTIKGLDNTKRMLLMVGVDGPSLEALELTKEVASPLPEAP